MSAFFFSILPTASARQIVTIAGSPSGTAATASEIPVIIISNRFSPLIIPQSITTAHIPIHAIEIILPKCESFFCSGVGSSSIAFNIPAISPICVFCPIFKTFAVAFPLNATVPIKILSLSLFSTAVDSPVSIDSSQEKLFWFKIIQSAGILSPEFKSTISSGTSSRERICDTLPSRITVVVCGEKSLSASSVLSVLYS